MQADPREEVRLGPAPTRHAEDGFLSLMHRRIELMAIEEEECLKGRMADTLVPIGERVVLHQRESERGRLFRQVRIQVGPAKCLTGQGDRRLQRWESAKGGGTPSRVDQAAVKLQDLTKGEVPH